MRLIETGGYMKHDAVTKDLAQASAAYYDFHSSFVRSGAPYHISYYYTPFQRKEKKHLFLEKLPRRRRWPTMRCDKSSALTWWWPSVCLSCSGPVPPTSPPRHMYFRRCNSCAADVVVATAAPCACGDPSPTMRTALRCNNGPRPAQQRRATRERARPRRVAR